MLGLDVVVQNPVVEECEGGMSPQIEGAIAAGTHDVGVETLIAESVEIIERRTVYTHAATGAETRSYRVRRRDRNRPLGLDEAHRIALRHHGELVVNPVSNRAAVRIPAPGRIDRKSTRLNSSH